MRKYRAIEPAVFFFTYQDTEIGSIFIMNS